MCLCFMVCLGGMRFTYVLKHITRQHITHHPKILKIQFLLVLRTTATSKHYSILLISNSSLLYVGTHSLANNYTKRSPDI
jgi:hypothetical protein